MLILIIYVNFNYEYQILYTFSYNIISSNNFKSYIKIAIDFSSLILKRGEDTRSHSPLLSCLLCLLRKFTCHSTKYYAHVFDDCSISFRLVSRVGNQVTPFVLLYEQINKKGNHMSPQVP